MEQTEERSAYMVEDPRTLTDLGDFVESLVTTAKGTVRSEREYITFMLSKRAADTLRKLTGSFASVLLYGIALVMASICGAYLLGQQLGNTAWGFGCVAGLYLLMAIVFGALWKGSWGKSFAVNLMNNFHGH